ncbi:hypothetical protein Tco_0999085, partial [Tanacetum coccineum]
KGLLDPNGGSGGKFEGGFEENVGSCGGNGGRGGSIDGRGGGSLAKRLMVSKDSLGGEGFVFLGGRSSKECFDGWVGAGGGESMVEGKVVVKHLDSIEEPINNRWEVIEHDKEGTMVEGWRSNKDRH